MNRKEFYASLRKKNSGVFGTALSSHQVATMESILDQMQGKPIEHIAYTLATAYHEPGPRSRMVPNRESLYYSSASRIRQVWPSRFSSTSAAAPYARNSKKLANKVYNGRLGNRNGTDDGFNYRGGGLDHLTGRAHYQTETKRQGIDLVGNPNLILAADVAVSSLVHGMTTGRYRRHKLSDYGKGGKYDYVAARNIVNADSRTNGPMIAKYAYAFERSLRAAGYDASSNPTQPQFVDYAPVRRGNNRPSVAEAFLAMIASLIRGNRA